MASNERKRPPEPGAIRLINLDLDGTLLRRDNTIGARTIAALHEAHRRGVTVVLNSGRMTPAMERPAELLGLDVFLISYNGAVACAPRAERRRRLFERPMRLDVARELVALARERKLQLNYYLDELVYSEMHEHVRPWIELYRRRTGSPYRIVERIDAHLDRAPMKVLFIVEPALRDELEAELRPLYEPRATVTRTDPEYLEFLHPAVDKAAGLRGLCEALGIAMQEVLAVGDSDNDEPAVRAAGWGVGVANAREKVRAAADALTEADCDHDGVGEAVERWVLGTTG